MSRMFNRTEKFQNAWQHYSDFEWGCCCCENIQIAPRVHYASTHSLNTWTRPPPALTLSAMVPDSNSCGWRMAWGAQWCRDCPGDPSAITYYCVCVCVCVCIVALWSLFVWHRCPLFPPDRGKDNGYCICSHKKKLFLQTPETSAHHHLSLAWWRLETEGRTRT